MVTFKFAHDYETDSASWQVPGAGGHLFRWWLPSHIWLDPKTSWDAHWTPLHHNTGSELALILRVKIPKVENSNFKGVFDWTEVGFLPSNLIIITSLMDFGQKSKTHPSAHLYIGTPWEIKTNPKNALFNNKHLIEWARNELDMIIFPRPGH